jgi:putative nucleotidyltransferase with HDIG domain
MISGGRFDNAARGYFRIVPVAGVCVLFWAILDLVFHPPSPSWLALATLTVFTGSFTVKVPGMVARISVSEPFVFAATLWFGPSVGAVTASLDALIISFWLVPSIKTLKRVVFNVSVLVISIWVSAHGFFMLAGIDPRAPQYSSLADFIVPLYLFSASSFFLNSGLIAIAIAFDRGQSAFKIWREQFLWLSLNYFGGASVAAILVVYAKEMDWAVVGIIVPLLTISYLTFRTTLGRLDDANNHLLQVNKMYLSTIETLAMAIDAKDQITHGHIRRVQRLAVGLSRVVGVNDETQIKAIEAAALLHDMGKLAIPEFILNKPGRLTGNEFDVMKQHANIGADILGSIQFPYPVVPIVRHHHESWDGSGYPDGLKGVAIPLGARILSVVDCFDALTSDRPYRPRLSTEDAIAILVQRRGSMYDPLIIDKFIEAQQQLSEIAEKSEAEGEAMETIATKLRIAPEPEEPPLIGFDDRLPLKALSLLRSIKPSPAGISIDDVGLLISNRLSKLANFSTVALYIGSDHQHSIRCAYADGPLIGLLNGPEIQLGEQLSGWVAAHRTPIWNSDATLDLSPEVARAAGVSLGSSVPLIDNDVLVGTVTLYSPAGSEIGMEQRMLIQVLASSLAKALSSSIAHDEIAAIDARDPRDREVIYAVMDALLSSRAKWPDRSHPDRLTIVRVTWHVSSTISEQYESMLATLERAIAAATNSTGHVIRLGSSDLLVVAAQKHLSAAGLAPKSTLRVPRPTDIDVVEIANSLQLREALGLTVANETQSPFGKPLIH